MYSQHVFLYCLPICMVHGVHICICMVHKCAQWFMVCCRALWWIVPRAVLTRPYTCGVMPLALRFPLLLWLTRMGRLCSCQTASMEIMPSSSLTSRYPYVCLCQGKAVNLSVIFAAAHDLKRCMSFTIMRPTSYLVCVLLVSAAVVGVVSSCCTGVVQWQCMHSSILVLRLYLCRYCW